MLKRFLVTISLLFFATLALAQADPAGRWQGVIGPDSLDLKIRVTLQRDAGALAGTLDIPVQGLLEHPLADVTLSGSTLSFKLPGIPGDPQFAGEVTPERIEGEFTQSGQSFPFFLERSDDAAETAADLRPQEPRPPFPYRSEEVRYASLGATLAGTLTLPAGDGPFAALLLITGSGAQDRDETLLGHKPFLLLADQLTRAGYAVLRVDDRGVGGSSGSDADSSYADLLIDVLAGVRFLAKRSDIDASRIGLLGHSQGGYLAPAAAVATDDVAFVIMLAGPSVNGTDVLLLQNELLISTQLRAADPNVSDAVVAQMVGEQLVFLQEMHDRFAADDLPGARATMRALVTEQLADVPAEHQPSEEEIEFLVDGSVNRSFQAFLLFDPQPLLRELTVPLLAIYGGRDLQVPPQQSVGPLEEALSAAGNPDYTIEVFPELNHLLQPAETGLPDEYGQITTTMDPAVLELLEEWLQARF